LVRIQIPTPVLAEAMLRGNFAALYDPKQ